MAKELGHVESIKAAIASFGHGGEQLHNVCSCVALALLHQGPQPQARAIDRQPVTQRSWGLATKPHNATTYSSSRGRRSSTTFSLSSRKDAKMHIACSGSGLDACQSSQETQPKYPWLIGRCRASSETDGGQRLSFQPPSANKTQEAQMGGWTVPIDSNCSI